MIDSRSLFDGQGETYDRRVGLAEIHCREIARAALEIAAARPGDLVVEWGAGTGSIGSWLMRTGARYVGLDFSRGMLETFRRRPGSAPWLLQADGNRRWPLAGGSARLVFGSRMLHWLDAQHATREIFRVALPAGATVLSGRVRRREDSVRFRMRQQMRRLLRRRGHRGRSVHHRRLMELCCLRGAEVITSRAISRWKVSSSPGQSLEAWRGKPGLAGLDLPVDLKQEILHDLEAWAEATFGALDRELETEEMYVIEGVRLAADPRSANGEPDRARRIQGFLK